MTMSKPTYRKIKELFEISDVLVSNILYKVYPDTPMTIERRIDRAKAVVYVIERNGKKEVMRLSVDRRYSAQIVANAYQAWEKIGVPVPHVREVGSQDSIQYLLMDYIADLPFTFNLPLNHQLKVVRQMGKLLARMRDVQREGFGQLDMSGKGEFKTWNELVKSYYTHEWIIGEGFITVEEASLIRRIKNTAFPQESSVLLHGDYKLKNMFVNEDGNITAVTDPNPMAGDPLWDFAGCNHFVYREQARRNRLYDDAFYAKLRDTFKSSYEAQLGRTLRNDELHRIELYEILIDAGKVESLMRGKLDEAKGESDFILDYLKHKISRVNL